jgi:protein-S-isoprenylcysteine O-methyltransferase Ste14
VALGRSWGMPMTLRDKQDLVTHGPYAYVRHPIYTGMAAMAVGTALAYPIMLLWAAIMVAYVLISALREERDMVQLFPDTYPAYKQRSKMLVPFVL